MKDTLFVQWWKIKWSYKFQCCIKCNSCDFKHKWRGLCTRCWDKKRDKTRKRIEQKKITKAKWHKDNYKKSISIKDILFYRTNIFSILNTKEKLLADKRRVSSRYYHKNKDVLNLINTVRRRIKRWKPCLKIIINWKDRYLPFESLDKPKTFTNKRYDEYILQKKQFKILTDYYNKWT